jgi:hypothetical protein
MIASVNWQYVLLTGGGSSSSHRVARRTAAGSSPTTVNSGVDLPSAGWSRAAPSEIFNVADNRRYIFAFWSIVGRDPTTGDAAGSVQGNPANASFTGGTWTVTATAYYVWAFGPGSGDNALLIDAFDIDQGGFIPDDFVDASPDPGGALTLAANDGYIDTDTQITAATTIAARDSLPAKQFAYWLPISSLTYAAMQTSPPTIGSPNSHDIVIHPHDIVVAFAFYNDVRPRVGVIAREPNIYDIWWWIKTHGGTGPDNPEMREYAAAVALMRIAASVAPELRREVLALAQRQLGAAATGLKSQIASLDKQARAALKSTK